MTRITTHRKLNTVMAYREETDSMNDIAKIPRDRPDLGV